MIENRNEIIYIHDKDVKNIAEYNLLHDIINPPKRAKNINSHYSPITHECMNTRKGRANFKNFQIILDSGCSSKVVMGRLVGKLNPDKDAVIQLNTQALNITSNYKVKLYFALPVLNAMNSVMWKFHVDDSAKSRYDMILGKDI